MLRQQIYIYDLMRSNRLRMRSCRVVRVSDCQFGKVAAVLGLVQHKVRTYKENHNVCPLVGTGTLPTPLSPAIVPLPPEPGGGGAHLPAGEGLGESQFRRLEKKLSTLPSTVWVPASCDTVKSEGRQMKQCLLKYIKIKVPQFFKHF
jgi:hypothetical protein